MGKLPTDEFDEMTKTINITLVISHCEESLKWIKRYIGTTSQYKIVDIAIYSKCGKEVEGLDELSSIAPTTLEKLPNVGRCDHTYATWIIDQYNSVTMDENGNDIVFFLKDNDYHVENYYTFEEVFSSAVEIGFGCLEKPVCDCDNEQCNIKKDIPLMLHDQKKLNTFSMNTHNRLDRDKSKQVFKTKQYRRLKDWKEAMKFVIPHSEAIPVCYGGMFASKRKQFLNQPKQVWENVAQSLSRGNNIVEGHFAERLWAAILSGTNEGYAKAVSDAIKPHTYDTFWCWNRRGMLMVPRTKGFNSSLFEA